MWTSLRGLLSGFLEQEEGVITCSGRSDRTALAHLKCLFSRCCWIAGSKTQVSTGLVSSEASLGCFLPVSSRVCVYVCVRAS